MKLSTQSKDLYPLSLILHTIKHIYYLALYCSPLNFSNTKSIWSQALHSNCRGMHDREPCGLWSPHQPILPHLDPTKVKASKWAIIREIYRHDVASTTTLWSVITFDAPATRSTDAAGPLWLIRCDHWSVTAAQLHKITWFLLSIT